MASVIYLTDTRYGLRAWYHPSARHRCYHYSDALLADGGDSAVVPMERVNSALLKRFDHAVFHRPSINARFTHALKCCHEAGIRIHADYDDLVFHPDYASFSPQHISGGRDLKKVREDYKCSYDAAQCFDSFLVSTVYLKQKLDSVIPNASVTVLPNSLPRIFNTQPIKTKTQEKLTIGYFPGSRGHGEDLRSIVPVLKEILNEQLGLLIVGRINAEDYAELPNVVHVPFANYRDYLSLLAQVDVSIAPLIDNDFNQSKSAVKLIESVAVGTPIVASENRDMLDHDNQLSWLVRSAREWREGLNSALSDVVQSTERESVITNLQQKYSVNSRLPVMLEHLRCAA